MKKRALIITPVAFSLLVGLGACANNGETPDTTTDKVTKSLKIDTASVKKDYFVGEEFTSYGLKVYLVETSGETSEEKQLVIINTNVKLNQFLNEELLFTVES